MNTNFIVGATILSILLFCNGQENAQTRIPSSLEECYSTPSLLERDNRLPMTIQTLIDLIRKAEDSVGTNSLDIRQMSIALIHRFRLDGIERDPRVRIAEGIIPFSPSGPEFAKHQLLLSRLIPGNALTFPNETLTAIERCTLHFMLSSTIEKLVRGDEATRCNQLAQYRSERIPRNADIPIANPETEFELPPPEEEPFGDAETDIENINRQIIIASNALSQCPVESGVIQTTWGAISAGPLIAGIAAGLEQQTVTTRELLALQQSSSVRAQQNLNLNIDNRWAATLSGDLAEVGLHQGPINAQLKVGAPGAWNSTAAPKWYFLSQRENLQMTDAEIRGGLDGLILASNIAAWRQSANTLRLSSLLEMYYSRRGVFSSDIRACNRNNLFTTVAPIATVRDQTAAYSIVLERQSRNPATIAQSSIVNFGQSAAEALSSYMPTLSEPPCVATQITANDDIERLIATEILIYVDFTWTFREINPIISNLLDQINVNRFGTRFTILNANSADVLVNRTHFTSNLHQTWNETTHLSTGASGLNLPRIIQSIRETTFTMMNEENTNRSLGGRSLIALIVPNTAAVSDPDTTFALQQIQILREIRPDLRILFLAGGTHTRFNRFVQDATRDLFQIQAGLTGTDTSLPQTVNLIVQRIQQVPRRIINPRCNADWILSELGNNQQNEHVNPSGINFYRLHPNYFFHKTDNQRRVRIQGSGFGSITVCTSRTIENPRSNTTQTNADVNCQQILSNSVDIDLMNVCPDSNYIHTCSPLFISVQGQSATPPSFRCVDTACQSPDSLRFIIHGENLDCFSGVGRIIASLMPIIISFLIIFN